MKQGDILLIKSKYDFVGWLIRKSTNSEWNHVAIAVSDSKIIEARGGKVQINSSLKYLWNKFYKVKILRVKYRKREDFKKVIDKAIEIKNNSKKSSYFKFLIFILLLIFKKKNPFKIKTCSGFVADCFETINVEFKPSLHDYETTPEDIWNYGKFKNIPT